MKWIYRFPLGKWWSCNSESYLLNPQECILQDREYNWLWLQLLGPEIRYHVCTKVTVHKGCSQSMTGRYKTPLTKNFGKDSQPTFKKFSRATLQSKTFLPFCSFSFPGGWPKSWSDNALDLLCLPPIFSHRHLLQSTLGWLSVLVCASQKTQTNIVTPLPRSWAKICAIEYLAPNPVYLATHRWPPFTFTDFLPTFSPSFSIHTRLLSISIHCFPFLMPSKHSLNM